MSVPPDGLFLVLEMFVLDMSGVENLYDDVEYSIPFFPNPFFRSLCASRHILSTYVFVVYNYSYWSW